MSHYAPNYFKAMSFPFLPVVMTCYSHQPAGYTFYSYYIFIVRFLIPGFAPYCMFCTGSQKAMALRQPGYVLVSLIECLFVQNTQKDAWSVLTSPFCPVSWFLKATGNIGAVCLKQKFIRNKFVYRGICQPD